LKWCAIQIALIVCGSSNAAVVRQLEAAAQRKVLLVLVADAGRRPFWCDENIELGPNIQPSFVFFAATPLTLSADELYDVHTWLSKLPGFRHQDAAVPTVCLALKKPLSSSRGLWWWPVATTGARDPQR
jgi:hypothetical protein